jgi:hypothetical protein
VTINLPEVVEAIQEGGLVVQKDSGVFSLRNLHWWPGAHVTQSLIRECKSVVQSRPERQTETS